VTTGLRFLFDEKRESNSSASAWILVGKGFGAKAELEIEFLDSISIAAGAELHNVNTLHGARNITTLATGNSSTEIWGRLGLSY